MNMRCRNLALWFSIVWCLCVFSAPGRLSCLGQEGSAKKTEPAKKEAKEPERDDEYYELLRLFADTLDQIDRNYVKDVSRRELMEAAIEGMLSKLDQYSNYISPEELERFKGSVESEFGGIGIQVTIENGQLMVISPIVGSPAYRAGLMAGDKIVAIEGQPTKGITLDEAVRRMKGKVGTKVTITVIHPDDPKPVDVTLRRAVVRVRTVLGDHRKSDDTWDYFYDRDKKIGYVRVTAFSRHTPEELRAALEQLLADGMRGLILDLRFNPGGLLSAAVEVCDMFIKKGPIVSTEGRNAPRRSWEAHAEGTLPDFPMAILVNRYSASASEIVSACLQDHERAVIVGERTFGKGSVQNIIDLEGGRSALKLTTASYQRPSGKNIHRFPGASEEDDWGVRPNKGFEVKMDHRQLAALLRDRRQRDIVRRHGADEKPIERMDDPQLKKALEYLAQQLGDSEPTMARSEKAKPVDVPKK